MQDAGAHTESRGRKLDRGSHRELPKGPNRGTAFGERVARRSLHWFGRRSCHGESALAPCESILEDYLRESQIAAVRDGERNILDPQFFGKLPRHALKAERWFSTRSVCHFDVAPAHTAGPARAQGFHGRLFRGESSGIAFELIFVALAIGNFCGCVEALQNRGAMPREGRGNAVDFRDVQS